jgi:deoxyribodipyrimidine photolyase-related protein
VQGTLRLILGDQLTPHLSALEDLDPKADVVLMAEVMAECTYVKHHAKKLVLVLSAMRHFARALAARGVRVEYVRLTDPGNTQSIRGEVFRAVQRLKPRRVVATEPGEWRLLDDMRGWDEALRARGVAAVEIRDDTRFLARIQDFRAWARGKTTLRMEFFYRDMRRRYGFLMDGGKPAGGKWNYDSENRKSLPKSVRAPALPAFKPDAMTREVMAMVASEFPSHLGTVEDFGFPVTAAEAKRALRDFIEQRLPRFGDWQDAMKTGAPFLFHALISPALNLGLLDPREICAAAEAAWRGGQAELNAVEGFIRQILGWREFIRGIYWLHMPDYAAKNFFGADRKLPWFYWTGETRMNCLRETITDTVAHAYAHHIQRLMITGNFALLAGLDPAEVDEWYMVVYADAYQWVEMPNTRGMALFADGGIVGSKPYAASGAYINRMSDYCKTCAYDVKDAVGDNACPFNYLYWDFFARHEKLIGANPRLGMPLRTLANMDRTRVARLRANAARFLTSAEMRPGPALGQNARKPLPPA